MTGARAPLGIYNIFFLSILTITPTSTQKTHFMVLCKGSSGWGDPQLTPTIPNLLVIFLCFPVNHEPLGGLSINFNCLGSTQVACGYTTE